VKHNVQLIFIGSTDFNRAPRFLIKQVLSLCNESFKLFPLNKVSSNLTMTAKKMYETSIKRYQSQSPCKKIWRLSNYIFLCYWL